MSTRIENADEPRRFFALKQAALFIGMTMLVLFVDLFLLFGLLLLSTNAAPGSPDAPGASVQDLAQALTQDDSGSWTLDDGDASQRIEQAGAYAFILDGTGTCTWQLDAPIQIGDALSQNEIAVMGHDRSCFGATAFIWTITDSDLLVLCYPAGQFVSFGMTFASSTLPFAILAGLLVLVVDLAIIFLLHALSQRALLKDIASTLRALDHLGEGKPVTLRSRGAMRAVADRINRISSTLIRKESARKSWVAGISHDVRTPLAVTMGHAERIGAHAGASLDVRESAAVITRQCIRVRDLVEDLNIATQLEYDMQPLNPTRVVLSRTVRDVVVDYLNQGLEGDSDLQIDIEDDAMQAFVLGDERLVKRALRNAIDNALKHNAHSCTVTLALRREGGRAVLCVSDDGRGIAPDKLAALGTMLENDYLGSGSLVEGASARITFSGDAAMPRRSALPGAPEPPMPGSGNYAEGFSAPTIASQRAGRKASADTLGAPIAPINPTAPGAPLPPYAAIATEASAASSTMLGQPGPAALTDLPVPAAPALANASPESTLGASPAEADAPKPLRLVQHGLGLPLIARIVLVHGGDVSFGSSEEGGFLIRMSFPYRDATAEGAPTAETEARG